MRWSPANLGFGPGVHELLAQSPLLAVCVGLAAWDQRQPGDGPLGLAVWIGRRCWPYPPAIAHDPTNLLGRSVFVDPPTREDRLWAIDQALRSPAVATVVADGRGLTMAASRRLQLACEAGGAMGLLSRPLHERSELSAATTRWLVQPEPAHEPESCEPAWTIELLRRKGLRPIVEGARRWTVRVEDATRLVCLDAQAADRPAAAAREAAGQVEPVARRWG